MGLVLLLVHRRDTPGWTAAFKCVDRTGSMSTRRLRMLNMFSGGVALFSRVTLFTEARNTSLEAN